jgi:TolA-binding protein
MKNIKKIMFILLASTAVLMLTAGRSSAQKTSEQLFEKALYAEEMKGDLGEAVKIYQEVLKENPGNRQVMARALLHIGICYEKLGSELASQAYKDVINKYSEQAKEVSMARVSITRLEAFTAELSREAEKHMKNGNELFKRWEYESAIKEYENAVKSGPNTQLALNARYCIGQSWFRAGKYDAALTTFTKLIEENPGKVCYGEQ